MGSRGNIFVIDGVDEAGNYQGVYLYSHWQGSELPEILASALDSRQGRSRWNDAQYLARIIFCRMLAEDTDGETGFGISSRLRDNSCPVVVVDCDSQRIWYAEEGTERQQRREGAGWTFHEHIEQRPPFS